MTPGHRSTSSPRRVLACLIVWIVGCAAPIPEPSTGTSTLAGQLELRRHRDAKPGGSGGTYGDRRMRGTELVDYSRPGFAVVYLDPDPTADPVPDPPVSEVRIRQGSVRVRFEPDQVALSAGSRLRVHNETTATRVLSAPALGVVTSLAPGESIELPIGRAGDHALHILNTRADAARIFASPGPYVRVADSGRFVLTDLPPGRHRLKVWHARFPPLERWIDLRADHIEYVDLAIGVGQEHTPR